jgi:Tfp pilus assembly protein PilF
MWRSMVLMTAFVGLLGGSGCKGPGLVPNSTDEPPVGLLVGPEAISKAAPPVELPPKESVKLYLKTAKEFEKQGQTEQAISLYEKARSTDPGVAKIASRRLAVLYDRAGDFSKSLAEYEQLVRDNPKDADLLNDLGYSHYCRGDWATAETWLAKAVQIDPHHKRAWTNLGLARAQQAKWDESFQAFCKAVRPAEAHCNIAFVLGTQGRIDEAKEQYRQALALDPSLQLARGALAQLDNPKPVTEASKKEVYDPEAAAAQIPSISELEDRLIKEGKLPPRNTSDRRDEATATPPAAPKPAGGS